MNYQEIKSLNKEQFEALLQLSQTLNTASYEESLIEQMLDWVLKIINAERTVFAKFDEAENKFKIISARNYQNENIYDLTEFSENTLKQVLKDKKPILYHNVQSDPNFSQFESVQLKNIQSIIKSLKLGMLPSLKKFNGSDQITFNYKTKEDDTIEFTITNSKTGDIKTEHIVPINTGPVREFELPLMNEYNNIELKVCSLRGNFEETRYYFRDSNRPRIEDATTQKYTLQTEYPHSFFGCIEEDNFKNPPNLFAAKLIEESGCKGLTFGDAVVSQKHANFLINKGNATASDLENLGKIIIEKVYKKFNVKLNWEVKIIGE